MKKRATLGEQEIEVLRFVAGRAPCSVREVAVEFGEPRGLARTTVLTVMERLRKKGFLRRERRGSAWSYRPTVPTAELHHGLVRDFVDRTLGGSLSPFVAYLTDAKGLSREEVASLKKLVRELESRRRGGR